MLRTKPIFHACVFAALIYPALTSALVIEIQGITKTPDAEGSSCIDIEGSYPGFDIVASEGGKQPRICFNSSKINSIAILNTTFVATEPSKQPLIVKYEHEFPSGINGKIMARTKLNGFFSNAHGVGVPVGDKVKYTAYFVQNNHSDPISDPLDLTVTDQFDSAIFEYSVKKPYLISGTRTLRGEMKLYFTGVGQKLTLDDKSTLTIDTGSTMADKLESMPAEEPSSDETEQDAPPVKAEGGEAKAVTPKSRMAQPAPAKEKTQPPEPIPLQ